MSSAAGSRDLKNSGVEPKIIPLGYTARVLYTFLPHEKENTEIFVSEGDFVQLQYKVGGWVYVRTHDGESGYIPANFCSPIGTTAPKSSLNLPQKSVRFSLPEDKTASDNNVRSSWEDVCITQTSFSSKSFPPSTRNNFRIRKLNDTGRRDQTNASRNSRNLQPLKALHITQLACKVPEETFGSGRKKFMQATKQTEPESPQNTGTTQSTKTNDSETLQNTGQISSTNSFKQQTCEICNGVLSRFAWKVQNLASTDQRKADIEPRNLLTEQVSESKDGLKISFNLQKSNERDKSNSTGFTEIGVGSGTSDLEVSILNSLSENCVQCAVVRNYLNSKGSNSMSALYSNIRDLHLHAVSDSESESESDSENTESQEIKKSVSGEFNGVQFDSRQTGEDLMKEISEDIPNQEKIVCNGLNKDMKQSSSVSLPTVNDNTKQSVSRNKSFSGGSNSDVIHEGKLAWNDAKDVSVSLTCVQNETNLPGYHDVFNSSGECIRNPSSVNSNSQQNIITLETSNGFIDGNPTVETNHEIPLEDSKDLPISMDKNKSEENQNNSISVNSEFLNGACSNCQTSPSEEQKSLSNSSTSSDDDSDGENAPNRTSHSNSDSNDTSTLSNGCARNQSKQNDFTTNSVQNSVSNNERHTNGEHVYAQQSDSNYLRKVTNTNGSLPKNNPIVPPGSRNRFQTLPNKVNFLVSSRLRAQNPVCSNVQVRGPMQDGRVGQQTRIMSLPPPVGPIGVPRRIHVSHTDTKNDKQEEVDIRRTLHEHSVTSLPPRRTGQSPMRAHHSINSGLFKDSSQMPLKHTGRTILVKKFNKQMWRPPNGAPEGGESQRPFSPFGGTLPPSKIVKKKVVEVFV